MKRKTHAEYLELLERYTAQYWDVYDYYFYKNSTGYITWNQVRKYYKRRLLAYRLAVMTAAPGEKIYF